MPSIARYSIAAAAVGQMSLTESWAHADNVARVGEEARKRGFPPIMGVVYDDLIRKKWASKTKANDRLFKLCDAVMRLDRDVVTEAEALWSQVKSERTTQAPCL